MHINLNLESLLLLLAVLAACAVVARIIIGYVRSSWLLAIVMGFIGLLVGMCLVNVVGLPVILGLSMGGTQVPVVWAVFAAALCALLFRLFYHRHHGWRRPWWRRRW